VKVIFKLLLFDCYEKRKQNIRKKVVSNKANYCFLLLCLFRLNIYIYIYIFFFLKKKISIFKCVMWHKNIGQPKKYFSTD
jgi:hypothetical protein